MEILMDMTGSERVIPPVAYFFLSLAARGVSRGALANQSCEETERIFKETYFSGDTRREMAPLLRLC